MQPPIEQPERPSLTPEQIAFLQKPRGVLVQVMADGAWLATSRCRNVLEVALLIVHMRDEKLDTGAVPRLRAAIEKVVGPLPLQLTLEELDAFRRATVDPDNFEMT